MSIKYFVEFFVPALSVKSDTGILPGPWKQKQTHAIPMTMSHDAAPLNLVPQSTFASAARPQALKQCVEETMQQYFHQLDGQPVTNIYDMVLSEVEAPLLAVVMRVCQGNQCRAAEMMGLSRGTLRKKLQQHGML